MAPKRPPTPAPPPASAKAQRPGSASSTMPSYSRSRRFSGSYSTRGGFRGAEQVVETLVVIPPDGGWGWVVVISAFCCNFIGDGVMYAFGLFLNDIGESLNSTPSQITLANSVMTGLYYMSGPFVSALINKYGFRTIGMLGGLIACSGLIVTSYSQTVLTIILAYGIGGGMGFGMMYLPSIICIGFYFEKWRALAMSIAVCGSSTGIFLYPPVFLVVLKDLTWREKFRILAGMACFGALCSMTYRPLRPRRVLFVDDKIPTIKEESVSYISFGFGPIKSMTQYNNIEYPTVADLQEGSVVFLTDPYRMEAISQESVAAMSVNQSLYSTQRAKHSNRLGRVTEEEEDEEDDKSGCCHVCFRSCCRTCNRVITCKCCHRRRNIPVSRPMYRDDIFFTGSVVQLPEYLKSQQAQVSRHDISTNIDYHLSVSRIATRKDVAEEYKTCVICPEAIKRPLATIGFLTMLGLFTPYLFTAERAVENGMKRLDAYFMLSILGIFNTIGRIITGVLSSIPNVKALPITYICITICGIAVLLSSYSYDTMWQYVCIGTFGLTVACVAALRPIVLVELIGLEKLTNAYGISLMFQGLGSLTGITLAGFLHELVNNYELPFYFAGSVLVLSAVMLMPIKVIAKWEKRRLGTI